MQTQLNIVMIVSFAIFRGTHWENNSHMAQPRLTGDDVGELETDIH